MFYFIRHSKLNLTYKSHDEMPLEVLADLAAGRLNPSIDREFVRTELPRLAQNISFASIEKIYASPAKRCQDTAQLISNFITKQYRRRITIAIAPQLREVTFDLMKLYAAEDMSGFSIHSVNDTVFKAMAGDNEYCESAQSAYARVDYFFRTQGSAAISLCITHDFIMRVIELYARSSGKSAITITGAALRNTQRNLYLHGFAADSIHNSITPV